MRGKSLSRQLTGLLIVTVCLTHTGTKKKEIEQGEGKA